MRTSISNFIPRDPSLTKRAAFPLLSGFLKQSEQREVYTDDMEQYRQENFRSDDDIAIARAQAQATADAQAEEAARVKKLQDYQNMGWWGKRKHDFENISPGVNSNLQTAGGLAMYLPKIVGKAVIGVPELVGEGMKAVMNGISESTIEPWQKGTALHKALKGSDPEKILQQMDPLEVKNRGWNVERIKALQKMSPMALRKQYYDDASPILNYLSGGLAPSSILNRDAGRKVPSMHLKSETNWQTSNDIANGLVDDALPSTNTALAPVKGALGAVAQIPLGVAWQAKRNWDTFDSDNFGLRRDHKIVNNPSFNPQDPNSNQPAVRRLEAKDYTPISYFQKAPADPTTGQTLAQQNLESKRFTRETEKKPFWEVASAKDHKGNYLYPNHALEKTIVTGQNHPGKRQAWKANPAYRVNSSKPGETDQYLPL